MSEEENDKLLYLGYITENIPQIKNVISQLQDIKFSTIPEEEQNEYHEIINEYTDILCNIHDYTSRQIPVFKILIEKLEKMDDNKTEVIYEELDFDYPKEIAKKVIKIKKRTDNMLHKIKDKVKKAKWAGIVCILGSITLITTGILLGIFTIGLASAGSIVLFSLAGTLGAGGIGMFTKSIINFMDYDDLKKVKDKLKYVNDHLQKIIDTVEDTKMSLNEFKIRIKTGDNNLKEYSYKVLETLEKLRNSVENSKKIEENNKFKKLIKWIVL